MRRSMGKSGISSNASMLCGSIDCARKQEYRELLAPLDRQGLLAGGEPAPRGSRRR